MRHVPGHISCSGTGNVYCLPKWVLSTDLLRYGSRLGSFDVLGQGSGCASCSWVVGYLCKSLAHT